jgi:hypothetical protein
MRIRIRIRIKIRIRMRMEIKIRMILIDVIKETDAHFYNIERESYVLMHYHR